MSRLKVPRLLNQHWETCASTKVIGFHKTDKMWTRTIPLDLKAAMRTQWDEWRNFMTFRELSLEFSSRPNKHKSWPCEQVASSLSKNLPDPLWCSWRFPWILWLWWTHREVSLWKARELCCFPPTGCEIPLSNCKPSSSSSRTFRPTASPYLKHTCDAKNQQESLAKKLIEA